MKNHINQIKSKYPAYRKGHIEDDALKGKDMPNSIAKKILVIDYNEAILDVMKMIITDAGYTFISPMSDLIPEKIFDLHPDLIFIEDQLYNLPQGRKISKSLKRSALTFSIPIVMMTTSIESKDLISESEADTLLLKPFDINNLEAILHCS
ncbi:hypothetical protein [uncultured Chryseobacterium sp.]|uniref:response regulator n=1 Tax=uncultured Chryseobacterium sp. TaxID=259322 RepID=UPI0025DEC700|nr:hypothetical protein [uncultured Chryseobacterium sp.]